MDENTVATQTIDFTPPCLKTQEGQARVIKAEDRWSHTASQLCNRLDELFATLRNCSDYKEFGREMLDSNFEIQRLRSERSNAQEAFLRAVAGQP